MILKTTCSKNKAFGEEESDDEEAWEGEDRLSIGDGEGEKREKPHRKR
jgi:hypothetical protein